MVLHVELFLPKEHLLDKLVKVTILITYEFLDLAGTSPIDNLLFDDTAVFDIWEHQGEDGQR